MKIPETKFDLWNNFSVFFKKQKTETKIYHSHLGAYVFKIRLEKHKRT